MKPEPRVRADGELCDFFGLARVARAQWCFIAHRSRQLERQARPCARPSRPLRWHAQRRQPLCGLPAWPAWRGEASAHGSLRPAHPAGLQVKPPLGAANQVFDPDELIGIFIVAVEEPRARRLGRDLQLRKRKYVGNRDGISGTAQARHECGKQISNAPALGGLLGVPLARASGRSSSPRAPFGWRCLVLNLRMSYPQQRAFKCCTSSATRQRREITRASDASVVKIARLKIWQIAPGEKISVYRGEKLIAKFTRLSLFDDDEKQRFGLNE
jgi:hypothetical protein